MLRPSVRSSLLSSTSGPALVIDRTQIDAGATGVVAQLSSSLPGPVTFSEISGPDMTVASNGAVTFTAGLAAAATRTLVARAQNGQGDAVERSFTFQGVALPVAPVVTSAGTISGTRGDGLTISGTAATATGTPTPSLAYQWQAQDDGDWADIVGATGANLADTVLTAPLPVRRQVTATNSAGTTDPEFSNTLAGMSEDVLIPTTPVTSIVDGDVTWTFSTAVPAGQYVDGSWFVVSDAAFTVTPTPASVSVTGPNSQPAWINGLVRNPGSYETRKSGATAHTGNGIDSLFALDTRTGFPGQGIQLPSSVLSPPTLAATGAVLNIDPGYTGSPVAVSAGAQFTLAKAVSDLVSNSARPRIKQYKTLRVVPAAPIEGAFAPPHSATDLTPVVYDADIDLSGIPTYDIPDSVWVLDFKWDEYDTSTIRDELSSYNWVPQLGTATGIGGVYGREIAAGISVMSMLMMTNRLTEAQKRRFARNIVLMASTIVGRLEAGGRLPAGSNIGGHLQQWPMVVALAAWFTRNSARGQFFRNALSGPLATEMRTHFGAPRVVQEADWRTPPIAFTREAPSGGVNPGYYSLQPRPGQEGEVWSDPGNEPAGSGRMTSRLGPRDYVFIQFGSVMGMAYFLSKVPGGRALVPYPSYWKFMDMMADVAVYNRDAPQRGVDYKREGFVNEPQQIVLNSILDPVRGWPFPSQPDLAVTAVQFTPNYELLRGLSTGVQAYAVEQIISIKTNGLLSRNDAWLPVKEAFTVLRNGSPIAIDLTGATGSDARTNAAIQIRGGTIMLMMGAALAAGDTITVQSNFAAYPDSRPRMANGTLLPDFGPITAVLKSAGAPNKPNPLQTISMGGYETLVGGVADDGSDPIKGVFIPQQSGYLSGKYGVNLTTERWRRALIGWRGRLAPGGRSRSANALFMGNTAGSTSHSLSYQTWATGLSLRLIGATNQQIGLMNIFSGVPDDADVQMWILVDINPGASSVRVRVNNTLYGPFDFNNTEWPNEASLPTLGGFFANLRMFTGPTNAFPSRMALRECMIHVETAQRGMGSAFDLSGSQFAVGADWGSRGQLILPSRPDYAGFTDGGVPEYFFAPTLAGVDGNLIPNNGVWSMMNASLNNTNPDAPLPFVQVA